MKALMIFVFCSFLALSASAQSGPASRTQMTSTQFNKFLQEIRNYDIKSFSREDVEGIKDEIINTDTYFSTAQIRKLLSQMEKDSGKFAMARLLYSKVTDPDNYVQLSDLFTIDNYREEFVAWFNGPDKTYHKAPITL